MGSLTYHTCASDIIISTNRSIYICHVSCIIEVYGRIMHTDAAIPHTFWSVSTRTLSNLVAQHTSGLIKQQNIHKHQSKVSRSTSTEIKRLHKKLVKWFSQTSSSPYYRQACFLPWRCCWHHRLYYPPLVRTMKICQFLSSCVADSTISSNH